MSNEAAWDNGNENDTSDADGIGARVEDSMAGYASAGQDATVTDSLVGAVVAGRDAATSDSLCGAAVAGRDLHLKQAIGTVLIAGNRAMVDGSTIGLLMATQDSSFTNSQILMTGRQAIALGAAMGLVFALSSALLRRMKRSKK